MPSLSIPSKNPAHPATRNPRSKRHAVGLPVKNRRLAEFLRVCRTFAAWAANWGRSTAGGSFGSGIVAGLYLVVFGHSLTARFGSGLTFTAGALTAVTVGLVVGAIGSRSAPDTIEKPNDRRLPDLAVWAMAFGCLGNWTQIAFRSISLEPSRRPSCNTAVAFGVSLVLLGMPAACAARLGFSSPRVRIGWLLSGAATGLLVTAQIRRAAGWASSGPRGSPSPGAPSSLRLGRDSRLRKRLPREESVHAIAAVVGPVVASLAAGLGAAAFERLTLQLFPSAEAAQWTAWAGFLIGTAAGWILRAAQTAEQPTRIVVRLVFASATGMAAALVLFTTLTDWSLALTSSVSQVGLLMLARGFGGGGFLRAAGHGLGGDPRARRDSRRRELPRQSPDVLLRSVPALLGGYLAGRWALSRGVDVSWLIDVGVARFCRGRRDPVVSCGGVATTLARDRRICGGRRLARRRPCGSRRTRPREPHGSSFRQTSSWSGTREPRRGCCPFSTTAGCSPAEEGDRGTYTLWKHHGVQYRTPRKRHSAGNLLRPVRCLSAVLGPGPDRRFAAGTARSAAARPDAGIGERKHARGRARISGRRRHVRGRGRPARRPARAGPSGRAAWPIREDDNRVRFVELDPACAVQSRRRRVRRDRRRHRSGGRRHRHALFHARVLRGASRPAGRRRHLRPAISVRRFRPVARAKRAGDAEIGLRPGGGRRGRGRRFRAFGHQFAQGTQPARSAQAVPELRRSAARFRTSDGTGRSRSTWGLLGREVRRLIAEGAASTRRRTACSPSDLPQETMRWGAKREELAEALNPHAGRIAEWPNAEGNDPEVIAPPVRRVEAARIDDGLSRPAVGLSQGGPRRIDQASAHGDRRVRATATTASSIRSTSDRLNYLAALGQAAQARRPTLEALHQLEEFAEPYDPVLTYFVHHELASLYAPGRLARPGRPIAAPAVHGVLRRRARPLDPRRGRGAAAAWRLTPQAMPAAERWDHMNALLQFLKLRWNNRGLGKPPSVRIALNDLERTIGAAESTFAEMEKLRAAVGVSASRLAGPPRSARTLAGAAAAHLPVATVARLPERNPAAGATARQQQARPPSTPDKNAN